MWGVLAGFIIGLCTTITAVNFNVSAEEGDTVFNKTCLKNGGIEKANNDLVRWEIHCKDGARFYIH